MTAPYVESDIREIAATLGEEAKAFSRSTILLCGGAGFLGRYFTALFAHLNAHVLKHPCRVIVCDNLITSGRAGAKAPRLDGFRFLTHDIIKPLKITERIDYVIQAAGIASPYYYRKYPLETLEVATLGTKRVLELGVRHPLKGFLFFSSSEIYGDPDPRHVPTPESYRGNISCLGPRACYDESKRLGETLCAIFHELHGVPTRMVRPFNVYGPGMQETDYRVLPNFASRIIAGKPVQVYGSGKQTRTFCYVTDAITGFIKVLLRGSPGQAYNIGNPVPELSMLELARVLERVAGRKLDVRVVEYPDTYPADEPQRRCPDIAKAARQLGYKPAVSLEEGLKRFMAWASAVYTGTQF
ncbi:MAG: NAD-dependent epimerase/dehydratase family protein [Candidatus Omnitrophica bacterium]|nr:NAD-dependent epimerase/dehydratase family protein [Candidatus Omnitrophota bacterium]